MTSRDLVRRLFRRQPVERPPFLATAFYAAARVDGGAAADLILDPTRLSRAVIGLSGLIGSDCAAVRLEAPLWSACGLEVAWPAADGPPSEAGEAAAPAAPEAAVAAVSSLTETIVRLKAEFRGKTPVAAVVPGPAGLVDRLGADAEAGAVAMLRAVTDAACKAGAELLFIEEAASIEPARLKQLVAPLVNTARYYNASTVLAAPAAVGERIADGLLLPAGEAASAPATTVAGVALAAADLDDPARLKEIAEAVAARGMFVSIDDRALAGREINDVLAAVAAVRGPP